jgi:hypothetical protein
LKKVKDCQVINNSLTFFLYYDTMHTLNTNNTTNINNTGVIQCLLQT